MEIRFRPSSPLDLQLTLGGLHRGAPDPTLRFRAGEVWRATRTPAGPATTRIRREAGEVVVQAWGPGAEWALDSAPALLGELDDQRDFLPSPGGLIAQLKARFAGLRIPRSQAVFEALVPTILEQKVIGLQAHLAYAAMTRAFGEPAPGPLGLLLPPSAQRLAELPYWELHRFDVERRRAETIRLAARHAGRLEEALGMPPGEAQARLTALPGLGPWSAAEVASVALGDPDAVSVGDYHLPHLVSWALAREERGSDERMLDLLAPYGGHRGRVQRLLEVSGLQPPRRGPRLALRRISHA